MAPVFIQLHHSSTDLVRQELICGLQAQVAHVSPKYLYDELGSKLFEAITSLPEYYPTRTEAQILQSKSSLLSQSLPHGAALVDLGAGSCRKGASLFPILNPSRYVAVDISVEYLKDTLTNLQRLHTHLPMVGVGMDFSARLEWPSQLPFEADEPKVFFYAGSSIGNFSPSDALVFLKQVHALSHQGGAGSGLLIGVDLVKPTPILELAYDDPLQVTAAFNRNMLRHLNTLVGSNFEIRDWAHVAYFNEEESRIEMHLEALQPVCIEWPGGQRCFAQGERMHTENSYKWTLPKFTELLHQAGFGSVTPYTDDLQHFALCWARA